MLTSDKAICEMNTGELAEEYEYCMKSAESEALAPDLQRYFRDRAAVVKSILTKSGQGKRKNSPTIVPIGRRSVRCRGCQRQRILRCFREIPLSPCTK